jgi:microcin C transport system substrate-binding protein
MLISRRLALRGTSAIATAALARRAGAATLGQGPSGQEAPRFSESWGLSTFGDLSLPENFSSFRYVNPAAPKGGLLSIQITGTVGNQTFDTFDTFNIFSFRGDGAAGMESTFDSLMSGTLDEPDAVYGLLAGKVAVSSDKLIYRFFLRPEARFHDGSTISAADVAFSLNILKTQGHPIYRLQLKELESCVATADDLVEVRFSPRRARDLHLLVAGLPIFSEAWWNGRDFQASTLEAPLGSGPYRLGKWEQGQYVLYERVRDYWGTRLPVNIGLNNFDQVKYSYYRDRTPAFEDFKAGRLNYHEEFTAKYWALSYDFPAVHEGKVIKESIRNGAPHAIQGWYFNTRRRKFADPRIREALNYAFDFEWTNRNIMFSAYKRLVSFFSTPDTEAVGAPGPDEMKLLDPLRSKVSPRVFQPAWDPPVSDGSGSDRALLRRAFNLLVSAGCKRQGERLLLPDGSPFTIEFLDDTAALQPHFQVLQANLHRLGIEATSRIVDAAQYKSRLDAFDFDFVVLALGGSYTPGQELQQLYSSEAARTPGSRNLAGVSDPAVDALVEIIAHAPSREELSVGCRALDRLLRVGFYWIPMWYKSDSLIAYWDEFARPAAPPKFGTGAPGVWWWDADKAKARGAPT